MPRGRLREGGPEIGLVTTINWTYDPSPHHHPAMGHDFIHFTTEGTEAQADERPPKRGKDSGSLDQADMGPGVKPEPGSALYCVT